MKKRDIFRDISNDHSVMLQHATRLHQAARVGRATAHQAARGYLAYWQQSIAQHLLEEERCVLPAAIDQAFAGTIRVGNDQLRHQSDWLRVAVIEPSLLSDALMESAAALRHHVRLMEFEFIDNMVEDMGKKRAQWIYSKSQEYRSDKRPSAMGENRSEQSFLD